MHLLFLCKKLGYAINEPAYHFYNQFGAKKILLHF